jgi:hypothetical protein
MCEIDSSYQSIKKLWQFNLENHPDAPPRCVIEAFLNHYFDCFIDADELQSLLTAKSPVTEADVDFRLPSILKAEIACPQGKQPEPQIDRDLMAQYTVQIFTGGEPLYVGGQRPNAFTILRDQYLNTKPVFADTLKKALLTLTSTQPHYKKSEKTQVSRARPSPVPPQNKDNIFRKEGDFWNVVFQAEKLPPLKHCIGFEYIARLLEGQKYEKPLDLYYEVNGVPDVVVGRRATEFASEEDLSIPSLLSGGRDVNQQEDIKSERKADEDLQQRLRQLSSDRIEAKENNDEASLNAIDTEYERIVTELKGHTISRRRRKWDNGNKKAQVAISKAIKRALKHIQGHHSELGDHLVLGLIPVGFPYEYRLAKGVKWNTKF